MDGATEIFFVSFKGFFRGGGDPIAFTYYPFYDIKDAPQQLLPLPDSLPVDPDEDLKVKRNFI